MADDAELAFLQSQHQEYDPSAGYDMDDASADQEEYDPAATYSPQASSHSASLPPESAAQTPQAADSAEQNGLKPAPASADASAAPTPSKRPRTVGGFVDESEDEEEDPAVQPGAATATLPNAPPVAAETPQRSVTNTPNNTLPNPDVQLHSAQDQGAASFSASVAVNEHAPSVASSVPNGSTPVPDATKSGALYALNVTSARQSAAPATPVPSSSLPKARLPQDTIGILEDRVAEDPRGDIEAWQSLISEHRRRHKNDDARAVYERFLKVFPTAGDEWVKYIAFETELDELSKVEQLFGRSVPLAPYVPLYSSYIDFIRRRYNLTTDQSGQNRQVITQAYEFVLGQVGIDVDAGKLWLDYIEMLKTGPGVLYGSTWQDMQKMDTLRKVYQRAIAIPHSATLETWQAYNKFETSMPNAAAGRKNLQEHSPSYVTARSAINVLTNNIMRGIDRTTVPKLPPAPGFDGYEEYMNQVKLWKQWIHWEKSDPLECATDDRELYNKRVLHLYKNSLMALRFWPELWYEAAEWCFGNGLQTEGDKFLDDGIEANPESCLLAFKKGNQVELRTDFEDGQTGVDAKAKAVREPYIKLLDTLYDLTTQTKKREEHAIARAKEQFESQKKADEAARVFSQNNGDDLDDDDVEVSRRLQEKEDAFNAQQRAISAGYNVQTHTLKKTLTYAWIALMRAARRVSGKGNIKDFTGFRGVFQEARKRGKLLSEAYITSALIEHHCYQDPAAQKIFERGMKLFPEDEQFALEYIKHLIKLNDSTNARAVFETVVGKLTAKPENIARAKPLFVFFHDYEAQFGELAQVIKLEQRMNTLFPEDPQLLRFAERFAAPGFDPTTVRPIISQRTQMKPVLPAIITSIEEQAPALPPPIVAEQQRLPSPGITNSPRLGMLLPAMNSPKRPLEDADDIVQPRKLARGESPLKGAAGRRLDAARRNLATSGNTPIGLPAGPAPLPRGINFLLGIIPPAHAYKETRFKPEAMVAILRNVPGIPVDPSIAAQVQSQQPQRWGTTPTTAQQLQSIQEKYGNGVHSATSALPPANPWGL
ncbi:mRNA 3'-end-processing protein rna14 [Coniothyrium glycines]